MLNSKQRACLRSLSNGIDAIFQIGKSGTSENMIKQISDALEARELIKLRTLDTCPLSPAEAAESIAKETGADVVSVVGSKFVLYRESKNKKKIEL